MGENEMAELEQTIVALRAEGNVLEAALVQNQLDAMIAQVTAKKLRRAHPKPRPADPKTRPGKRIKTAVHASSPASSTATPAKPFEIPVGVFPATSLLGKAIARKERMKLLGSETLPSVGSITHGEVGQACQPCAKVHL